jgi:hypothetical protein
MYVWMNGSFNNMKKRICGICSNKIRLTGVSEPMALSRLEVRTASELNNYAKYMADFDRNSRI